MKISRIGGFHCQLGEGPVWDVEQQALYLTDVLGRRIWRHDPARNEDTSWEVPQSTGSFALRRNGAGAIIAMHQGLYLFDFADSTVHPLGEPAAQQPNVLFNDGKADSAGRFIAGTVETTGLQALGSLYSASLHGGIRQLDSQFGITNGPCWSPDGRTFYFADSRAKKIYAYDYDMVTGAVANRRVFADTAALPGIPDGATVDTAGRLWSAQCDGGLVVCYDSNGKILHTIEFPTLFVSSVMFGGTHLERLFVTSIDPRALAGIAPDAITRARPNEVGGALLVVDGLDATGLPEPRYDG